MSLTDGGIQPTMPVVPGGGGGYGGFGDGNGWWIILFFLVLFGGWGGNGFGGNRGGVSDGYVLTSDFANIERKLDGINNGICDSTFALNNSIKDGFSAAELARCNAQMAFMQQLNALQAQIASCCCDTREAIQGVNYTIATQGCDTRNLVQNTTRDIIDAMNAGFRGIDQRMTAQELAAKDAQIRAQDQRLFLAELRASQETQTNGLRGYIDGQFAYYNPRPVPSFPVQPPYQYGGCGGCGNCA